MQKLLKRTALLLTALIFALSLTGCFTNGGGNGGGGSGGGEKPGPEPETPEVQLTKYVQQTEIPTLKITASDPIESKFDYVNASYQMVSESGEYDFETDGEIRLRGNYTQTLDKKPYRVKFSSKQSPIGMDSSKTWELLAEATDFSFLRNYLGYTFADDILGYKLRARYVRVELNGEYIGLYLMTDKKGEDKERIPLKLTDGTDTGFLLEVDNRAIGGDNPANKVPYEYCAAEEIVFGVNAFYMPVSMGIKEAVVIKEPETPTPAQFEAIESYMTDLGAALRNGTTYQNYVDVDSMARYYIVEELWHNTDVGSVYFYRETGKDKVKMGPVWDLDLTLGISKILSPGKTNSFNEWYYNDINNFISPVYRTAQFYSALRSNYNSLCDTSISDLLKGIGDVTEMIKTAAAENFKKWDTVGEGVMTEGELDKTHFMSDGYLAMKTFDEHAAAVKQFLTKRAAWMKAQLS